MKSLFVGFAGALALSFVATTTTFAAQPSDAEINDLRVKAKQVLGVLPDKMPGAENDTPALIRLGQKLYLDKRLSVNNSISCNSCHVLDGGKGGVDNEPTSPGAFNKRGGRNSPTVLNAGLHIAEFWDGRAANLEEQAKGPVLNPIEMAMPNEGEVLKRLREDSDYRTQFAMTFPTAVEKITYDNVAKAIAAFERTLLTHDRLDDFLKGDNHALSASELAGLDRFLNTGCTTCHNGPTIGARVYQKIGLIHPYENTTDLGRHVVTKEDDDKFKFKVPSLRNIALTAPYFHDGQSPTLEATVRKMAWMQLDKKLTDEEVQSLVTFLKSLTDKERAMAARK